MASKKAGIIAGLAVAGLAVGGLLTSVNAFADPSAAPAAPTASAPADGSQQGGRAQGGRDGSRDGGQAMHQHTAVTGDEAAKVLAAVKAKFPDATVTTVEKDPDGSYDVRGTATGSDGARGPMYEVSADLATVTEGGKGGSGGGKGGPGGAPQDAPVTGDEATSAPR